MEIAKLKFDVERAKRTVKRVALCIYVGFFLSYLRKNPPLYAIIYAFIAFFVTFTLLRVTLMAMMAVRVHRRSAKPSKDVGGKSQTS